MTFLSDPLLPLATLPANSLQVLALAILIVFGIGYGKLRWQNRLLKKHQLADEEKRIKVEQLQKSGQVIKAQKSHDVAFGVRAIQKGIQVDGIWDTTTPLHPNLYGSLSDLSTHLPQNNSVEIPRQVSSGDSGQNSLLYPPNEPNKLVVAKSVGARDCIQIQQRNRTSTYKPRRSSHLQYGSHREVYCDEETLGRFESNQDGEHPPQITVTQQDNKLSTRSYNYLAFYNADIFAASHRYDTLVTYCSTGSCLESPSLEWIIPSASEFERRLLLHSGRLA